MNAFIKLGFSVRLLILGILLLSITLGLRRVVPSGILELLLIVCVVYVILASTPLVQKLRGVPPLCQWFWGGLFSLMLFGQLAQHRAYTFPFVPWTMYSEVKYSSDPNFDLVLYDFWAHLRDGQTVRLHPSRILPSARHRIFYELRDQIVAIQSANDPSKRAELMSEHASTLEALAGMQNRKFYPNIIETVSVYQYKIPLSQGLLNTPRDRRELWTIKCSQPQR